MATQLTKTQFSEILTDESITKENDLRVFQAMYSFEKHRARASQIGRMLGNKTKMPGSPINLQIGRLVKRVAEKYQIEFTIRESNGKNKSWDIFFDGEDEDSYWVWQLKPQLVQALEELKLTGEIQYSEEIPTDYLDKLTEGAKRTITVNSYERNSKARENCIAYWGAICTVCKFDFENEYGEIGKGFIHVHHLTPLSEIGEEYEVNSIEDLRPVCPNCHSMLHRTKEQLTIEQLKDIFNDISTQKNCR